MLTLLFSLYIVTNVTISLISAVVAQRCGRDQLILMRSRLSNRWLSIAHVLVQAMPPQLDLQMPHLLKVLAMEVLHFISGFGERASIIIANP